MNVEKQVPFERCSFHGLDNFVEIRKRPGHPLYDGPKTALVLRVSPAGVMTAARFVVEESDRRQGPHPDSEWISHRAPRLRSAPRLIGPDPRSSFRRSTYVSLYGLERVQSTLRSRRIQHPRGPRPDWVHVSLSSLLSQPVMSNGEARNSAWRIPHRSRNRKSFPAQRSRQFRRLFPMGLCCSSSESIRRTGRRPRSP